MKVRISKVIQLLFFPVFGNLFMWVARKEKFMSTLKLTGYLRSVNTLVRFKTDNRRYIFDTFSLCISHAQIETLHNIAARIAYVYDPNIISGVLI